MNRTLKFYGKGFGSSPVSINVTANGNVIYNGEVSTVDEPFTSDWFPPDQYNELFTTEIPVDFSGGIPFTVSVNSGTGFKLAQTTANYVMAPNPVYSSEQLATVVATPRNPTSRAIYESLSNPPFTQQDIDVLTNPNTTQQDFDALLALHNLSPRIPGGATKFNDNYYPNDSRTNVTLDGIPVSPPDPRPSGQVGQWTWDILPGSILAFTLMVNAGVQ